MSLKEENKVSKKKEKFSKILVIIIGLVVLSSSLFIIRWYHQSKNNNNSINNEIKYNDYIYKIRYDFGCESYIYLLKDNVIKTVAVQEIYEIMKDCNCMEPTGKYNYKEKTIVFSTETINQVIKVFDELYKKSGKKEFNTDNIKLTKYQQRILLAVITNNENGITIENNLIHEEIKEEIKNENNNLKIENSKVILNNTTKNKVVNKIANYLNPIVNNDFEQLNNNSKNLINNISENLGVNLKLDLAYAGPYSVSFTYTTEGQLGTSSIYKVKGYTFHYNGEIHEFDINGQKDKYYKEALDNFMKDDLYINNIEQLDNNWKNILYENMYLTGNWYLGDDEIVFLIPAHQLGFDEATAQIVTIHVKIDEEF